MIAENNLIRKDILQRFAKLGQKSRLAHAYLFVGPKGSGKFETAIETAKLINCEDEGNVKKGQACGKCSSCVKINAGSHPDIHIVEKEPFETIKIIDVRGIISNINLRAFMAKRKVFIVRNIENLTPDAGNALLKTLEEPTDNSLIILTTSAYEKNLLTIRSRCHTVYFLASKQTEDLIKKISQGEQREQEYFLKYFSEGCAGKLNELIDSSSFEGKNEVIDEFIFNYENEAYLKEVLSDKENIKGVLQIVLSWIRDAMLVKAGIDDKRLINVDRIGDLKNFQARYEFDELNDIYEQVLSALKLLADNLNIKMSLVILKEKIWGR